MCLNTVGQEEEGNTAGFAGLPLRYYQGIASVHSKRHYAECSKDVYFFASQQRVELGQYTAFDEQRECYHLPTHKR